VIEAQKEGKIVAKIAGQQEMFLHKVMAGAAHALAFFGITQQVADAIRRPVGRVYEETRVIIVNLLPLAAIPYRIIVILSDKSKMSGESHKKSP
jgi:hypothetical protein